MNSRRYDLVMAIFPSARGIAHVLFEGPYSPVDWGISDPRREHRKRRAIGHISRLLDHYTPDVLVLRGRVGFPLGRARLHKLLEAMEALAATKSVPIAQFSRSQIREAFQFLGSPTRYAIVETIAKNIPMFEPHVPPVRKIWKTEDRRMGLFDAIALALTFYQKQNKAHLGMGIFHT